MKNFKFKYPHINIYSEYTKAIQEQSPNDFGKLFVRKDSNTLEDLTSKVTGIVLSATESAEIVDFERGLYVSKLDRYNVGRMVYALYEADGKYIFNDISDYDIDNKNKEYYGISKSESTKLIQEYGVLPGKFITKNGSFNPQKCIKLVLATSTTDVVILSLPNYKYISLQNFLKEAQLVNQAGFPDLKNLVGRKLEISARKNEAFNTYEYTYNVVGLGIMKPKDLRDIFPRDAVYYNPFIVEEAYEQIKTIAPAYIFGKKDDTVKKKSWEVNSTANPTGNNLNAKAMEQINDDKGYNTIIDDLPF